MTLRRSQRLNQVQLATLSPLSLQKDHSRLDIIHQSQTHEDGNNSSQLVRTSHSNSNLPVDNPLLAIDLTADDDRHLDRHKLSQIKLGQD